MRPGGIIAVDDEDGAAQTRRVDARAAERAEREAAIWKATEARFDDAVAAEFEANRARCVGQNRVIGEYLYEVKGRVDDRETFHVPERAPAPDLGPSRSTASCINPSFMNPTRESREEKRREEKRMFVERANASPKRSSAPGLSLFTVPGTIITKPRCSSSDRDARRPSEIFNTRAHPGGVSHCVAPVAELTKYGVPSSV